jgi:CHAT domain-containing protein/tetratricopeptide (TPR) repeat protein
MARSLTWSRIALVFAQAPVLVAAADWHPMCPPQAPTNASEIALGVTHKLTSLPASFQIRSASGCRVQVEASARHLDLVLCLYDTKGNLLTAQDGQWSAWEREEMTWVTERPARLTLVVREGGVEGPDSEFRLMINLTRGATDRDREMAGAQRLRSRAIKEQLRGSVRAKPLLAEALATWRGLGDEGRMIELEFRLASIAAQRGEPEASRLFEALLARSKLAPYPRAWVLRMLAEIDFRAGRWADSAKRFEQAEHGFAEVSAHLDRLETLNRFAQLAQLSGDVEREFSCLQTAAEINERIGRVRERAEVVFRQGLLLASWGRRGEALDYFDQAEGLLPPGERTPLRARILTARGTTLNHLGDGNSAAVELDAAYELAQALGEPSLQANALSSRCFAFRLQKRWGDAVNDCRSALTLYEDRGLSSHAARARYGLGLALRDLGRHPEALTYFRRAREEAGQQVDPLLETASLLAEARSERSSGRLQSARAVALRSLAALESASLGSRDADLRTSFVGERASYYDLTVDLLLELSRGRDGGLYTFLEEAFEVDERFRARELLRLVLAGRRLDPGPRGDSSRAAAADVAKLLQDNETEAGSVEDRTAAWRRYSLAVASTTSGAPLRSAKPASLEEIQATLLPGDLLIQLRLREPRSLAWLVTRQRLEYLSYPSAAELEPRSRRVFEHLSRPLPSSDEDLRRLSRDLLEPLSGAFRGRSRLVIVADGVLQGFPWSALLDPSTGLPLVERFEIVQAPSSSLLVALASRHRPRPERQVLALGDPAYAPFGTDVRLWTPLPGSGAELQAIERYGSNGWRIRTAKATEASRKTLLDAPWPAIRVLHLATHSEVDSRAPHLSRLALAQLDTRGQSIDGALFAYEVAQLPLATDLVVLSGCSTAQGTLLPGEGLVGLTHAFFAAGTDRVLASLWPVEDGPTATLMERFYHYYLGVGLAESSALRAAQLDLRRHGAPASVWASFILQGRLSAASPH